MQPERDTQGATGHEMQRLGDGGEFYFEKRNRSGETWENIWGSNEKQLKGPTWEEAELERTPLSGRGEKVCLLSKVLTGSEKCRCAAAIVTVFMTSAPRPLVLDIYFHSDRLQVSLTRNLPNPISKACKRRAALGTRGVSEGLAVWSHSLRLSLKCHPGGRQVQI